MRLIPSLIWFLPFAIACGDMEEKPASTETVECGEGYARGDDGNCYELDGDDDGDDCLRASPRFCRRQNGGEQRALHCSLHAARCSYGWIAAVLEARAAVCT